MRRSVTALAIALCLAGCANPAGTTEDGTRAPRQERPPLGLFTTLPILWNETDSFDDLLTDKDTGTNPVRAVLEERYDLRPLDYLDKAALASLDHVMLAQPRALSPEENVAMDDWVRAGGTAILFADPLLTSHSRYALGDPRRPQDVTLLSPILARWGLQLVFDPEQREGEREANLFGALVPVDMAGQFRGIRASSIGENTGSPCEPERGIAVACRIGKGWVLAVADAAMLQPHDATNDDLTAFGTLLDALERVRR